MSGEAASISERLLEKLVCPLSRTKLVYDPDKNELISQAAGIAYPIRNGTPVMVVEEARQLD